MILTIIFLALISVSNCPDLLAVTSLGITCQTGIACQIQYAATADKKVEFELELEIAKNERLLQEANKLKAEMLKEIESGSIDSHASSDRLKQRHELLRRVHRLTVMKSHLQLYLRHQELFESNPSLYKNLAHHVDMAVLTPDKEFILESASVRFRILADMSTNNFFKWSDAWLHYIICMKLKGDLESFQEAEAAVQIELKKSSDDMAKKAFLKQSLSRIYSDRASSRGRSDQLEVMRLQLDDLKNAIEYDKENEVAKQWLTILGSKPEIGDEARKVYDPRHDQSAPWVVLSELEKNDNPSLIIERVGPTKPGDPQELNKLAHAHLVSETPNAEQALLLVDQAITSLGRAKTFAKNRPAMIASVFDTRGVALMQLDRLKEAAAAFEVAFRNRPDDKQILLKLIKCYETVDKDKAKTYRQRLKNLDGK